MLQNFGMQTIYSRKNIGGFSQSPTLIFVHNLNFYENICKYIVNKYCQHTLLPMKSDDITRRDIQLCQLYSKIGNICLSSVLLSIAVYTLLVVSSHIIHSKVNFVKIFLYMSKLGTNTHEIRRKVFVGSVQKHLTYTKQQ